MNWIAIGFVLLLAQPLLWAGVLGIWLYASRTRRRLVDLELAFSNSSRPAPTPAAKPAPVILEKPAFVPPPPPGREPAPKQVEAVPLPVIERPAYVAPPEPRPEPRNWEAAVGGSWVNKAGVVLLVIGIALLLGYSFHRLDAVGRVAMGAAVGTGLLAAGMWSERREAYRTFGYGLVGGGWAALYFTAFAAHAVPAARIIESSAVGSAVLGGVATAMIASSLRYRSQTVTALAYFLGFLTLGISELSGYALAASVPLAVSLLFVARRYEWTIIARSAVPAAYGLFVIHALQSQGGDPRVAQTLILIYWVLFEAFEYTSVPDLKMLTLNAVSFVPCSYLIWGGRGQETWLAPAIAAAVYACSAMARSVKRPDSAGYRASAALAAALSAVAILSKLSGFTAASALLFEGELLWVMGFAFGQKYLRWLGTAILAVWSVQFVTAGMHDWHTTTPMAVAACFLFLLNRILLPEARYFSYPAAALAALVIGVEVPTAWVGVAWLVAACAVYEIGERKTMPDFLHHAIGLGLLSLSALAYINLITYPPQWGPRLCGAVLLLAAAARTKWEPAQSAAAAAGAVMGCAYLFQVMPAPLVAVAWTVFGAALFKAARIAGLSSFATTGHGVLMVGFARLVGTNFELRTTHLGISERLLTVAPVVAIQYWMFWRTDKRPEFRRVYLYTAAVGMSLLLRAESGNLYRTAAWAIAMLVYLWAGRRLELWDLRIQGYALGMASFARFALMNLGESQVVPVGAAVAGAIFGAHFLARYEDSGFDRLAGHVAAPLGALTVGLLLWDQVSGGMLTMAWGLEGIALLAAGFASRGRTLRLTGLAALAVCVLKLFLYDLRNLDTPYRIASFLVLGALLIAVSWVYTRFRAELERYL